MTLTTHFTSIFTVQFGYWFTLTNILNSLDDVRKKWKVVLLYTDVLRIIIPAM